MHTLQWMEYDRVVGRVGKVRKLTKNHTGDRQDVSQHYTDTLITAILVFRLQELQIFT